MEFKEIELLRLVQSFNSNIYEQITLVPWLEELKSPPQRASNIQTPA